MKISVDDIVIFELSENQKNVIKNYINEDIFEDDMKRRLEWILNHLYEQSFIKLKKEWDKKLEERGIESLPTNKAMYAQLVFSQPDYKSKKMRDDELLLII